MTTETTRHTPTWRTRLRSVPRRSNFDRYFYRVVEEHRGEPIPPGMLDRYSVVAKVQGESQEEADTRARLIAAAPDMAQELESVVEMHDGRCDSCGCEIAPEGYCGCEPSRDVVAYERRCHARALLRRIAP